MKTKQLVPIFIIAATLQACSNDSNKCKCGDDEKCYEGVCYPLDTCKPDCTGSDKCYKGTCISQDQCAPDCQTDEKCYQGTCYPLDACKPDCTDEQKCYEGACYAKTDCKPNCTDGFECVNGECQDADPTKCNGLVCKSQTEYCDESGHWAECESGYGCHLGYCIEGLAPECKAGECHESGQKICLGGKWKACGSLEQCQDGTCQITEETCTPGTCSEDKTYRCNEDEKFEKCNLGNQCYDGECVSNYNKDDAMLWQTCTKNSDCAFGSCIFELSTSNRFTSLEFNLTDVNYIPVHLLDSRIQKGMGICSADCTQSASVCDAITEPTSKVKFTCQVMVTGDSPYPPKDNEGLPLGLPFHKSLDLELMSSASFAAACRPNDAGEYYYSKNFCKSCVTSDDCSTSEVCTLGMCLNACTTDDMCPIGFACKTIGNSESNQSVCMPQSKTCGDCVDLDGDGQGFGHCDKAGFDCDDLDPTTYYTTNLPPACTETVDDKNCNGKIDRFEFLGSPEHCSTCDEACYASAGASHITRTCLIDNGGAELDDYIPESYSFVCNNVCAPGYADCDDDVTNGCETQIANVSGSTATATVNGVMYALDNDNDNYGTMNASDQHFCCKSHDSVCYAMPETTTNPSTVWNKTRLDASKHYVTNTEDCDDDDATRNPGQKDICNGKDDDCNEATKDGSASTFKDIKGESYALDETCTVYNPTTQSICSPNGKVICDIDAAGNASMICQNYEKTSDEKAAALICNGQDDNCNGQIDEDWDYPSCNTGKKGICALGVLVCSGGTTECHQLYQPRPYDLYGDGIDSNCDGYDYDLTNAVFVENYGTGGLDGNDSKAGTISAPFASLNKAIEKACSNTSGGSGFCQDIFLSASIKPSEYWGASDISIPTFSSTTPSPYTEARTFAQHAAAYKASGKSYDANKYLYTDGVHTEVYMHKHAVRIYGGMTRVDGQLIPTTSKTSYTHNRTEFGGPTTVERTLLYPKNKSYSISLAIHNVSFAVTSSIQPTNLNNNGVTVAGLQCGKAGCRELLLDNTTFSITAPNGIDHSIDSYNTNDGPYIWSDDSRMPIQATFGIGHNSMQPFANSMTNYMNQKCIRDEQHGNLNKKGVPSEFYLYTDSQVSSLFKQACPDGRLPLGGCGGQVCSKSDCDNIGGTGSTYRNGRDGQGYYTTDASGNRTGAGANVSCDRSNGCDSNTNQKDDKTKVNAGSSGAHGPGGSGGDYQKIQLEWATASSGFKYITSDASQGNGIFGTSGGGGGGGGVYRAYSNDQYDNAVVMAASGGAGGCGGRGGVAGGTGGTAIGLVLVPPASGTADIQFINGTYFSANGGAGGSAQNGENGIKGSEAGDWMAYAWETGAFLGIDEQCLRTSGSGRGGAGGGGGSGAGGRAGHAYGVVFYCNRNIPTFAGGPTTELQSCGFSVNQAYLDSPGAFATTLTQYDKLSGKAGSSGNDTLGGSGGTASSGNATTKGTSAPILLLN